MDEEVIKARKEMDEHLKLQQRRACWFKKGEAFQACDDCESSPSNVPCSTLSQPVFLDIKLSNDFCKSTSTNQEKFLCHLECTMYNQDEITVKVVGRDIIVEAPPEKQHEKGLYKKFHFSDSFDLEKAEALLSSDKTFTLYVPKNKMAVDNESSSNIEETGKSFNKEEKEIQKEN